MFNLLVQLTKGIVPKGNLMIFVWNVLAAHCLGEDEWGALELAVVARVAWYQAAEYSDG